MRREDGSAEVFMGGKHFEAGAVNISHYGE